MCITNLCVHKKEQKKKDIQKLKKKNQGLCFIYTYSIKWCIEIFVFGC